MISNTQIIRTNILDPWWNLAVEEYLMNHVTEKQCILYLWQNQNTVVIGRNQNPWKECRKDLLEKEGGKLARRLSGGGTVFHDIGNLNFTFIMKRDNYDANRQTGVIVSAVRKKGIFAQVSGRNDLTIDGRKFSGTAFCHKNDNSFQHGTLLISSDFDKLTRYLNVSQDKIISKGIESVRSRVVNLSEYKPGITIEEMANALSEAFIGEYGGKSVIQEEFKGECVPEIQKLYNKYASWEWRFGETHKFDIYLETRFEWGCVELGIELDAGLISKLVFYSDAMDASFIGNLPSDFSGLEFDSKKISKKIREYDRGINCRQYQLDIADWIENKGF